MDSVNEPKKIKKEDFGTLVTGIDGINYDVLVVGHITNRVVSINHS